MSTNRTSNYNLNQWVKSDRVLMSEFNADNVKIDAALAAHDTTLASHSSSLAGKASASALSTLQNTVSQHTTALAGKGNCQLYTATYVGDGTNGSGNPNSLSFPKKVWAVLISSQEGYQGIFIQGVTLHTVGRFGAGNDVHLTWEEKSVRWYAEAASTQLNTSGKTYRVVALLQAD